MIQVRTTPLSLVEWDVLRKYFWKGFEWRTTFPSLDGFLQDTTGSGQVYIAPILHHVVELNTGSTLGSRARVAKIVYKSRTPLTWDKDRLFGCRAVFTLGGSPCNAQAWITIGGAHYGNHLARHIGIVVDGSNRVWVTSSDGTTQSGIDTGIDVAYPDELALEFDYKAGKYFVADIDGAKFVKATNLPAGGSFEHDVILNMSVTNYNVAATKYLNTSEWHFVQEE